MRIRTAMGVLGLLTAGLCYQPFLVSQEKPAKAAGQADSDQKQKRQRTRLLPATKAFLESLTPAQKEKATLDFDSEKRVQWHFIPKPTRKGLPLMEMEAAQQEAAHELLRAVVSQVGYSKATTIMQLESILLKLEGPQSKDKRNPEKYYFTIFGEPANKQRWGLSIEGHHLSLNFTLQGNQVLDSTPQFFATNPAELKDDFGKGFPKGLKVLRAEEQLAFKLVKSLNDEQFQKALLPGDTPDEIRDAGDAQPPQAAARGVAFSDLTEEQLETAKKLMKAYTSKMKPAVAKQRWELIDEAGVQNIRFAWSGPKRPGVGHYYIVQGPTFLIEFINVQPDAAGNPANHVHCVWRDMQGDFDLPLAGN